MTEITRAATRRGRLSWWIRGLYAVLFLSVLALATLLVGEIVYAFESDRDEHDTHSHGFYGPIFDLAWLVFLPSALITLIAGVGTLVVGGLRRAEATIRYGRWALGYCLVAVGVIVLAETLGS
jgi:uncharacterized membrane protein YhaH (DUF805 family)